MQSSRHLRFVHQQTPGMRGRPFGKHLRQRMKQGSQAAKMMDILMGAGFRHHQAQPRCCSRCVLTWHIKQHKKDQRIKGQSIVRQPPNTPRSVRTKRLRRPSHVWKAPAKGSEEICPLAFKKEVWFASQHFV